MTEQDIFFTHTIVGPPLSIELGRPLVPIKRPRSEPHPDALQANMASDRFSLGPAWRTWCLIQGSYPYPGLPRRRPGKAKRVLERYALVLACVAVLMMLISASIMATVYWQSPAGSAVLPWLGRL